MSTFYLYAGQYTHKHDTHTIQTHTRAHAHTAFCAVYMNPVHFHTGLMVVKPDKQEFEKLTHALSSKETFSYDGADQGFLTAYFADFHKAPLFDPMQHLDGELCIFSASLSIY